MTRLIGDSFSRDYASAGVLFFVRRKPGRGRGDSEPSPPVLRLTDCRAGNQHISVRAAGRSQPLNDWQGVPSRASVRRAAQGVGGASRTSLAFARRLRNSASAPCLRTKRERLPPCVEMAVTWPFGVLKVSKTRPPRVS